MAESTGHEYLKSHQVSGDAILLDIAKESPEIVKAAHEAGIGHTAKTLVKDGPLRIILLGMKAGAIIREHEAAGPASIHVISGEIRLVSPGRSDELDAGKSLVFGPAVSHSLEARSDAAVLVTIAWPAGQ